ncbi:MAG: hypothetical protein JWN02_1457 [Acidobacteria bacterium]|nr:hypothetical protein [Acidobacteriota bacterium]
MHLPAGRQGAAADTLGSDLPTFNVGRGNPQGRICLPSGFVAVASGSDLLTFKVDRVPSGSGLPTFKVGPGYPPGWSCYLGNTLRLPRDS